MSVAKLISQFAKKTILPVDVNEVAQFIKDNHFQDRIEFIGVDLDISILRGKFHLWINRSILYGDQERCAHIYYAKNQSNDWKRFVCCKELIHIFDPKSALTSSEEDVYKLANKIGLPPEMQDPINDGLSANIDRFAEFRALAVMFPLEARNILLSNYRNNEISIDDISRLADIPRRYVAFAMHENWTAVHELLIK